MTKMIDDSKTGYDFLQMEKFLNCFPDKFGEVIIS